MINWIIDIFTMQYEGSAFRDIVDGRMVYYYRDINGDLWLKNSKYSTFKVKAKERDMAA